MSRNCHRNCQELRSGTALYVDPTARIFGDLSLAAGSSLWPYAVIRAESQHIAVGVYANVQDFVMIHEGKFWGVLDTHHCRQFGWNVSA